MESLNGVDRMLLGGTRATLVLEEDATLTEADVRKVLEDRELIFESFERRDIPRAAAAYVAETPGFT